MSSLLDGNKEKICESLKQTLPAQVADTWMQGVDLVEDSQSKYALEVPNAMYRKRVREFHQRLQGKLAEILGREIELEVRISERPAAPDEPAAHSLPGMPSEHAQFSFSGSNLDPSYIFETFVVGKNNQFAHAAALAVAETPGEKYNPLFIYGGVGLGKTHLLHAIGNFIKRREPHKIVIYLSSEQFTNEYVQSLRTRNTTDFRYKYRNMDIFLLDDVQFLSGKNAVQEELFHTFNELHKSGKHIIFSSDRPPRDIPDLEERLRSRFAWGLSVDLQVPDKETRLAILQDKAQRDGMVVGRDILEFIANNVTTNIRELESCLTRVMAFSKLTNRELTTEMAKEFLRDIIVDRRRVVTGEHVVDTVADYFKISVSDIKSKRRSANIVYPRQVAMYIIRRFTETSLEGVGNLFGGRDHTTVLHAINKIEKHLTHDPSTMKIMDELMRELGVS